MNTEHRKNCPDLHTSDDLKKMASKLGSSTNQRRIVFLGRAGSGKSASGNNILGKIVFKSRISATSVTKKCQRGTAIRFGRPIQIIDSPGLFDTGMTNAEVTKEIVKCVGMTAPGPHAFVLVTRIDRFTEEEQKTVEYFKQVFGKEMVDYLLVLFTRKDDLIRDQSTLEEYLETVPRDLKKLLQVCQSRCIAFNNTGSDTERDQEVGVFLEMIDDLVMQNGNQFYTNEMFVKAEMAMQEFEKQLKRESEEENPQGSSKVKEYFAQQIADSCISNTEDYRERARKEVNAEHPGLMKTLLEYLPKVVIVLENVLKIVSLSLELRERLQ